MDARTLSLCVATAVVSVTVSYLVSRRTNDRLSTVEARVDTLTRLSMKPETKVQPEREVGPLWWCNRALCFRTEAECKEMDPSCHQQRKAYCMTFVGPSKVPNKYNPEPYQLDVTYGCMPTLEVCRMGGTPCIGVD